MMIVRPFITDHLNHFVPNEVSQPDDIAFAFDDDDYYKYSLWKEGKVKAIVFFRDNGGGDIAGFFLISDCFTARDGVLLKKFMFQKIKIHQPERLWTASLADNKLIERWHV